MNPWIITSDCRAQEPGTWDGVIRVGLQPAGRAREDWLGLQTTVLQLSTIILLNASLSSSFDSFRGARLDFANDVR